MKSGKDLWKMQIFSDSLVGTKSTEWRCLRVADMRDVGVPRIIERSFQHNGLNASIIAPKTYLMCANSSDFWISENAYWRIWEYREQCQHVLHVLCCLSQKGGVRGICLDYNAQTQ